MGLCQSLGGLVLYMQRAVEHLRERKVAAPDEVLAHLSPMSWAYVGLTGDYLWADAASARGLGR
ncbi:MAG: Tn3 family transposase [Gemmatimonadaceae bacterium]|nr:Tn3 family transposase [Caulobacter sp.]